MKLSVRMYRHAVVCKIYDSNNIEHYKSLQIRNLQMIQ